MFLTKTVRIFSTSRKSVRIFSLTRMFPKVRYNTDHGYIINGYGTLRVNLKFRLFSPDMIETKPSRQFVRVSYPHDQLIQSNSTSS